MSRRVKSGKNHAAHTQKKHDKKLRKQSKWQKSDDKDDEVRNSCIAAATIGLLGSIT
jgi:hypothetical protein